MIRLTRLAVLPLAMLFTVAGCQAQEDMDRGERDKTPEIVGETVEYVIDGDTYEGYVAYDAKAMKPSPGILVVHQWMGITDYEKMRAKQLAELGYVAFVADMYGKGKRAANSEEARQLAGAFYGDREMFRTRANAALQQLRNLERVAVDPERIGAMGYCFGGTATLELARSGADINGFVSFHGGLANPNPEDAANIKAPVLVLHGQADPTMDAETVESFKQEMFDADAYMIWVEFDGALHSFTQESADESESEAVGYDPMADKMSWKFMRDFWEQVFAK